jgi:outer membrane protein assembly factor BamB
MSIIATAYTLDRKGSRYLAWGLWMIALCSVLLVNMSSAQANDNLQDNYYALKAFLGPIDPPPDTIPPKAINVAPSSGSDISKTSQIVIFFSESMNPASLKLGGNMAAESDGGKWSARVNIQNNTLTISPKPGTQWKLGSQRTLTIEATDIAPNPNRLETLSLKYTVVAPPDTTPPTATIEPAIGSEITPSNQIIINFNESMNPASLALGGNMVAESDGGVWSSRNNKDDTLTISPKTQWNVGSQRMLTIDATDIAKNSLTTLSLSYTVKSQGTPGTLKWRFESGDQKVSSAAIGADGTIYVGSSDKYAYALNSNGTLKWRFEVGYHVSIPTIGADGTIYLGSWGYYVYALNPDGTLKWRFPTGDRVGSSVAIGTDGTLYVGSFDNYIYALNPDGTFKWRFETGDQVWSSAAIGADGTIYVGSYDNYIYALNPDGSLKWNYQTGGSLDSSPAIGADRTIYVGANDKHFYALNPDGSLKWRFPTGRSVWSSPTIGADGTIYFSSNDNYVYALNPDGTLKWRFPTENSVSSSPAIGMDGTLYIGSLDNYIYALNPDGSLKWRFKANERVWTSAAIGADGTVYLGAWDGYLYAIHGGTPLAMSAPWPKFQHNNQNTGRVPTGN